MGEKGDLKNLWKNFWLFLKKEKENKKKEEEKIILRRKKLKQIKDNTNIALLVTGVMLVKVISFVLPSTKKKEEEIKTKKDVLIELKKLDKIDEKIEKSKTEDELFKCRDELVDIHEKASKKSEVKEKEKVEKKSAEMIKKVDKKLDEINPIKKENEISIGDILMPGIEASISDVINKKSKDKKEENKQIKEERKEEKKKQIKADINEATQIKNELDTAILFIEKQTELQKVILNSNIQKKPVIFKKLVANTLTTTLVTQKLFANPAITLFANAIIINNTMRGMRKRLNKKVEPIHVNDLSNTILRYKELERYTKSVFSNSLFQVNAFKKEFKEKYKDEIKTNPELSNMLKEVELIESYIRIQMTNQQNKIRQAKEELTYTKKR
jgi:hypothetical protein